MKKLLTWYVSEVQEHHSYEGQPLVFPQEVLEENREGRLPWAIWLSDLQPAQNCNHLVWTMFIFQDISGSSELQEIMRRRQEKISAAASDSGVESFDEGSSH